PDQRQLAELGGERREGRAVAEDSGGDHPHAPAWHRGTAAGQGRGQADRPCSVEAEGQPVQRENHSDLSTRIRAPCGARTTSYQRFPVRRAGDPARDVSAPCAPATPAGLAPASAGSGPPRAPSRSRPPRAPRAAPPPAPRAARPSGPPRAARDGTPPARLRSRRRPPAPGSRTPGRRPPAAAGGPGNRSARPRARPAPEPPPPARPRTAAAAPD